MAPPLGSNSEQPPTADSDLDVSTLPHQDLKATHRIPFIGLWLFTLVLYLRPNDILPIGEFPVAKIVGVGTLIVFFLEELSSAQPFSNRPRELTYLLWLVGLMFISVPLAISPGDAIDVIFDSMLKVVLIFVILINVVTSYERLLRLMQLTVLCATVIALGTLRSYQAGEDLIGGYRATGIIGGMFGNPNDLALAINLLIPLAVGLALTSKTFWRRLIYFFSLLAMVAAVLITYSRGGFVTIAITLAYALIGFRQRLGTLLILLLPIAFGAILINPSLYWERILSIFDSALDAAVASGSGGARTDIIMRALSTIGFNPKVWLVGVGVGNFYILSIHDKVSHNAYLDVLTEIGLPAFILYLLFLSGVFMGLSPIMRRNRLDSNAEDFPIIAIALRASLIAYMVGSFFASVAYQWYLYYIAGYAICLRRIAEIEPTTDDDQDRSEHTEAVPSNLSSSE